MPPSSEPRTDAPKLFVGIGASAGGLKACTRFLAAMPAESGMAFVIVMHLDPASESHMAEIFQRSTSMPVVQVRESQRLAPDHVYVIAPSTSLEIRDGILNPSKLDDPRGRRKPIDAFFSSLANDQKELAVAIVMSGTGNNGSSVIPDFKASGGLCLVQDPKTADFDGMPHHAIATGGADHVIPPEEMPQILLEHAVAVGSLRPDKLDAQSSEAFDLILEMMSRTYRVNFRGAYKRGTLKRRTERRMDLKQVAGWPEYLELLRRDEKELASLYGELLIGVTQFFRDPAVWKHLEMEILPALLARQPGDVPFKIWVPGCATGEEAYSLAILVLEQLERLGRSMKVQIFASDVGENALAFARRGIYPSTIREVVSQARLARFFRQRGESFEVGPDVRESITFAVQNLLADPPFSNLDLVSCRNALIYFEAHAQQKVLELFHFALKPGGLLLLGSSETVGKQGSLFESLSPSEHLYRTTATTEASRHHNLYWVAERAIRGMGGTATAPPKGPRVSRVVEQIVLARYTWACVAVSESFEIQSFFGPTQDYLLQPTGEARMDLLSWVKPGIYPRLRAGLEKAREGKARVKVTDIRIERDGVAHRVECTIEPITPIPEEPRLFLVSFRDLPTVPTVIEAFTHSDPAESFIHQLEGELKDTREELQSTVEQLESTNEEYRASREEMLSLNEELQSNNEELQASKEELQSMNEEMATINRQLEDKNLELRQISTDLNNLLASASIPIIFLDRELRVRRFTPAATELMRLVPSDLGRSIEHIKERFHDRGLIRDAQEVLDKLVPITTEVQAETRRWYTRAMRPYRTEDDRIDGVCVAFLDISELKQAARQHEEARRSVEAIIAESPAAQLVLDAELRVVTATSSFCKLFQVSRSATEGVRLYDLGNHQWDIPRLRQLLEQILPEEAAIRDYEVTQDFQELGRRTMRIHAHRMNRGDLPAYILLSIEDLTARRTIEEMLERRANELAKEHERKNEFLAMLGHELRNPIAALVHGIDLLQLTRGDEARIEEIRSMMERQTTRVVSMLDQLLDLARVTSGKILLVRSAVDLTQAVRGAVETTTALIESRRHKLRLSLPAERAGPVLVEGDAIRLAQVVENLLSNAAKYTEEGGSIELALELDEKWARIRVRDSGIGMEADLLPHVFELFVQGPRGLERAAGGLGLGLPLVKRLVEMHGGKVEATSAGRGQGSELLVSLPRLPRLHEAGAKAPPSGAASEPREVRPYRILLVDDELDVVKILARLLKNAGHEVSIVHDGPAALAALGSFTPEVVILDLGLPEMDGYEVARRIREEPQGKAVLLIALTGYQADHELLERAGFDHHQIKPLSMRKLFALLASYRSASELS
jgi:two-component system, chemotaxis family, CheB/CheR fusion protein